MSDLCPEMMSVYYRRIFPFSTFFKWLSYSGEGEGDNKSFICREFSFTLASGAYLRYNSFENQETLQNEVKKLLPVKIDLGAEYSAPPDQRHHVSIEALRRELVFDIDMTDYDDLRKCCKQANICSKCWPYMTIACKIIDSTLKIDFGFKHCLWVFSGRRGLHCWVCDQEPRAYDNEARIRVVDYLNLLTTTNSESWMKTSAYNRRHLPTVITRSMEIIDEYFVEHCVITHGLLETQADITKFLSHIPDESFAKKLEIEFAKLNTSLDRWNCFLNLYNNQTNKDNWDPAMRHLLGQIKISYAYPRLDINVTKGIKHLLKSPFCVHPGTGKICVPFSAKIVDKFDPFSVPTLNQLLDEINTYDKTHLETESSNNTDRKDGRKTSLLKSLVFFEGFMAKLINKRLDETGSLEF